MLAEIADGSLINMLGDCLEYSFAVALANSHRLLFNKSKTTGIDKGLFLLACGVGMAIA